MIGLLSSNASSAEIRYVGSDPVVGKLQLEGILISVGKQAADDDMHSFSFRLHTNVSSTLAEFETGELVFPRINQTGGPKRRLYLGMGSKDLFFPVYTAISMNGRRFIVEWYNGSDAIVDCMVVFFVHAVEGGEMSGDPSFFSGERLR